MVKLATLTLDSEVFLGVLSWRRNHGRNAPRPQLQLGASSQRLLWFVYEGSVKEALRNRVDALHTRALLQAESRSVLHSIKAFSVGTFLIRAWLAERAHQKGFGLLRRYVGVRPRFEVVNLFGLG